MNVEPVRVRSLELLADAYQEPGMDWDEFVALVEAAGNVVIEQHPDEGFVRIGHVIDKRGW